MTETPEIPEAALTAAGQALADEAGLGNECGFDARWRRRTAGFAITAALPHLNPEPTFTASEVKELTTKATEVALELGRKEMLEEVLDRLTRDGGVNLGAVQRALRGRSQPQEAVSNGLTAPTGHSDLPPTPEAARSEESR